MWVANPDGSYTNNQFPVRLIPNGVDADLLFLSDTTGRKLSLDDLFNNPIVPVVPPTPPTFQVESVFVDERQASNVNAGPSFGAQTSVRNLNTFSNPLSLTWFDGSGITGGSKYFEIVEDGTYSFLFWAEAYNSLRHQAMLVDVTNSIRYPGKSSYAEGDSGSTSMSMIPVVVSGVTRFRLDHYTQQGTAQYGLGVASHSGQFEGYSVQEVYSQVIITRMDPA